jgi:hypothetical protein
MAAAEWAEISDAVQAELPAVGALLLALCLLTLVWLYCAVHQVPKPRALRGAY